MRLQSIIDTTMETWIRKARAVVFSLDSKYWRIRMLFKNQSKVSQLLLSMQYKQLLTQHAPLPRFEDVEFTAFSQTGEDGILLYIFSLIGTTNKKCVEACCSNGIECNTANLIINHGWQGLLFDGNAKMIRRGQQFYRRCPDHVLRWQPKLVQAWVTAENINTLIQKNGFVGEIDLLSLDIDGIDYWLWKAIECINPRVVVLENNYLLGPDVSVTIPYKPDFKVGDVDPGHYGASLAAFVKLGKQKGYRLVGCHCYGVNAFFVRSGIGEEVLPEISPAECFEHPWTKHEMKVHGLKLLDKEWVEV